MTMHRSVRTRQWVMSCARILAAAATVAVAGQALAWSDAAAAQGGSLYLRAGTVRTTPGTNLLINGQAVDAGKRSVIQLDGPMTAERAEIIAKCGITLGEYLPDNAWIVRLDRAGLAAARVLPFVTWVGAYENSWKVDPELAARPYASAERKSIAALGLCQVVVVLFNDEAPQETLAAMAKAGAQVIDANPCGQQWLIDAVMTPAAARDLAQLPAVQFIEDAPEATLRNDSNRWILQSNVNAQTPVWDRGIHGEGQVAGLIDDTPRESHCMFDDTPAPGTATHRKFIGWRNAGSVAFHGTHTAGTLAGDNLPYGTYTTNDGMAFAAKISYSGLSAVTGAPSTLNPRLLDAQADGARAHSNSWGDDGTTAYTTWCRQIDQFTWDNEDNVVAFAVTNQSSLKTPENSINVLAVGASNDTPNQAGICSGGAGPTADGRRKPEIFAPGCNTTSASSSTACDVTTATGTSMACPAITGAAVLVRQYYTAGYYPSGSANPSDAIVPSGALIRATLLNAGVDMTSISGYPTNNEGWGRLLLDNSLFFPGDARKLRVTDVRNAQGLTTGQQVEQQIVCNSSSLPLRVTLVWTGPAATVGAANPVINNLDLEVVSPSAALYRGNSFTSGQSSTGGSADLKNNVEQFLLNTPATGTYTIRVRGTTVNQGAQGFALAITGDISDPCVSPTIDNQPGPLNVDEGQPAVFSVAASGTELRYQWRRNASPITDSTRVTGSAGNTLMISAVTAADAGAYDVVITNACDSATSNSVQLSVNVGNPCPADLDGTAGLGVADIFAFLSLWFANDPRADWDGANGVGVPDIFAYLSDWFAGCP